MTIKVDVEKYYEGEYWTNRYHIVGSDLVAALVQANRIVGVEKLIHVPGVLFTKYRVSDITPGTDSYISVPINENGQGQADTPLPLFNVVRVLFHPTMGRPGFKLYRGCLTENDIANGRITASALANLLDKIDAFLDGEGAIGLTDLEGDTYNTVTIDPRVSMRQLRRGTRRRTTPIL